MTDKEKILKCIEVLNLLKSDAEMALNETWDKSDIGFMDQIIMINNLLNEITYEN